MGSSYADTIKTKISCIDCAKEHEIPLKKQGDGSYRTPSFDHNGSNPLSCQVWEDHWYSYSGNVGGDVIDMVAWLEYGGNKSLAYKSLLERFGLADTNIYYQRYTNDMASLEAKISHWESELRDSDVEYLHSRKIKDSTIKEFHMGYSAKEDRLIIPVFKNNHPVYWCGRDMSGSPSASKYKKAYLGDSDYIENIMYGYDTLSRSNDDLYIVEGVFDYLSLHQEGYTVLCNATGLSHKNARYMSDIASSFKHVYLCFDNDASGNGFTTRLYPELFKRNIQFYTVDIPKNIEGKPIKDVSDWYTAGFSLQSLFDKYSTDGIVLYLNNTFKDFDTLYEYADTHTPYMSRKIKTTLVSFAGGLPDITNEDIKDLKRVLKRPKNQDEYANDFISDYPMPLLYNNSLGFYQFNGKYWETVDEMTLRHTFEDTVCIPESQERQVFNKVKVKVFTDKQPNSVNCLNLKNGTLYFDEIIGKYYHFTPAHEKSDFCDYVLDYAYDPEAQCDDFDDFLNSITSHDQPLIDRFMEYFGSVFIDRSVQDKCYLFYGNGSNGKSVLTYVLENLLGNDKLCAYVGMNTLSREFQLANLIGKRVNFCHESSADTKESEEYLKSILSNTYMMANIKNKSPVYFRPKVKFFFDSNQLPKAKDQTDGWNRRFSGCIHAFQNTFTSDLSKVDNIHVFPAIVGIEANLSTPEALSYVLKLSLEGYKRIIDNGYKFSPINIDKELELEFSAQSNILVNFVREYDWMRGGFPVVQISSADLFEQFQEWEDTIDLARSYRKDRTFFFRNIWKAFQQVGGVEQCTLNIEGKRTRGYRRIQDE